MFDDKLRMRVKEVTPWGEVRNPIEMRMTKVGCLDYLAHAYEDITAGKETYFVNGTMEHPNVMTVDFNDTGSYTVFEFPDSEHCPFTWDQVGTYAFCGEESLSRIFANEASLQDVVEAGALKYGERVDYTSIMEKEDSSVAEAKALLKKEKLWPEFAPYGSKPALDKLVDSDKVAIAAMVASNNYGLDKLVDHESPVVRAEVARKGFGLDKLVSDKDESVVIEANNYLSHNGLTLKQWAKQAYDSRDEYNKCVLPENREHAPSSNPFAEAFESLKTFVSGSGKSEKAEKQTSSAIPSMIEDLQESTMVIPDNEFGK